MKTFSIEPRFSSAIASMLGLSALIAVTVVGTNLASASSALGPTNAQRRSIAIQEVRHLLAVAPLPPGATRLTTYDTAYKAVLGHEQGLPADPDSADVAEFFRVTHGASAITWLNHVRVNGAAHTGSGSSSGPGSFNATFLSFSFPATSILQQPQLEYSMITDANGALQVRVDAQVLWSPRKSVYSQIANIATRVVAVVDSHGLAGGDGATTTVDSANVGDLKLIIAKINALPPLNPGVFSCPLDDGSSLALNFYDAGSAKSYAQVAADPGGCGLVTITQYGADGAPVGKTTVAGGTTLAGFVARILHLKVVSSANRP